MLFAIILNSCSKDIKNNEFSHDINFKENISFKEFKIKLDEYVKNSSYPNINN